MSSSRDNILARIRRAQGRSGAAPTDAEREAARAVIARRERGPLPDTPRLADPAAQFRAECERLGTTHDAVASRDEVPAAVARYLQAHELERRVVLWHELAGLDWAGAGIEAHDRPANADDRTGVTGCFCAVAETGSLMMLGAPETPKATALLPETHIAVVSRARIVATLEDAFAALRAERGEPPRATWLVSGPSRTADIEMTLVVGAHGPYRVHAILAP